MCAGMLAGPGSAVADVGELTGSNVTAKAATSTVAPIPGGTHPSGSIG